MTNEEERIAFLVNYLNSRTVLNHTIRSAISMTICVIVLSFFMKVTPREIINILYFVIGWNALLSFVPQVGLHYIKAALANVILAGIVIAASFYMQVGLDEFLGFAGRKVRFAKDFVKY